MRQKKRLGLIEVLSGGFREACLPHPREVLSLVHSKLPVVALKRNEDLLSIIKVRTNHSHATRVLANGVFTLSDTETDTNGL